MNDRPWLEPLEQRRRELETYTSTRRGANDTLAKFHLRTIQNLSVLRDAGPDRRSGNRTGPLLLDAFERHESQVPGERFAVVLAVYDNYRGSKGYFELTRTGQHGSLWEVLLAENSDLLADALWAREVQRQA